MRRLHVGMMLAAGALWALTLAAGPATLRSAGPPTTRPATTLPATTRPAARVVAPVPPPPDYAAGAAEALVQTVCRGDDPRLASAAADALAALGAKATPAVMALLANPDASKRALAVEIAGAMNDTQASVPVLVAATRDKDAQIRQAALGRLNFAKVREPSAICAAAQALRDSEPAVQEIASEYLTDLGAAAAPAVPGLAAALDARSIRVLSAIGPRSERAVPALVAFYQNRSHSAQDRLDAVQAIGHILGRPAPATQPAAQ